MFVAKKEDNFTPLLVIELYAIAKNQVGPEFLNIRKLIMKLYKWVYVIKIICRGQDILLLELIALGNNHWSGQLVIAFDLYD